MSSPERLRMFNGQPIVMSPAAPDMLESFLDALPANSAIIDRSGVVVAVNRGWRLFAESNGAAGRNWIGANYFDIAADKTDPDVAIVVPGLRSILSGGLASFEHEYPCHSPTRQRWFRCISAPLVEPDGKVWAAAVLHFDVTARRLAEEKALGASRAKSEFVASLAHELRTPLNAVIGFSEMMLMQVWGPLGSGQYLEYAQDIHDAGRHLLSLINDILDLSKVEAGKLELDPTPFDLNLVAQQSLHLLEEMAARSGISVASRLDPALSRDRVVADARLVRQMLLNLLSNAIKFTPEGGQVLAVTRRLDDDRVSITVIDTGIGISAADINRVLEPFGQVRSEHSRRSGHASTGLGLPLCKRFAELHNGRLTLSSEPGRGTSVEVVLPMRQAFPAIH